MFIAQALLKRKQLEAKVKQLEPIYLNGKNGLYETNTKRRNVNENVDEVTTVMPRITLEEITKEYDHYASELRKLDGAIQQANWKYEVDFTEAKMKEEKNTSVAT